MQIDNFTFLDYFQSFYPKCLPIALFVLCYLLFKNKPKKIAYVHLFVVIMIVFSKHWATMFEVFERAKEMDIMLDERFVMLDYLHHAFFTALSAIAILALLHRPHNIGYDTLLKKEIWGVWYQENNTRDYFDAQERKLRTQGAKDNEQ